MQIQDLRQDFEAMSALMHESWGGAARGAFLGASLADAAAVYDGDALQGFVCAFPRRARLAARDLNLQCLTFLTCAPGVRGQGIGTQLWREALKRAHARGYDGCVYYFQDGSPTQAIAARAASGMGYQVHRLLNFGYLGKALGGPPTTTVPSAANCANVDVFLELSGTLAAGTCLSRVWTPPEADWQCSRRLGTLAVERTTHDGAGILTGYVMPLDDPGQTRICVLEDILYQKFSQGDRQLLLSDLLGMAASTGATMAIVPLLGYADMGTFRDLGFRRLLRKMHAELTVFDAAIEPDRSSALYMDVF
jgi:GNAT superfamily N-acetyltransferase